MTTRIHVPWRRAAGVALLALAAAGCGGRPEADAAPVATPPRDTALLSAEAVRLAGLTLAPAESAAWREGWTAPARLDLDPTAAHALGAVAEGRVTRVLVRVGDPVRARQVLASIHSHELMDAMGALAKASAVDAEGAAALEVAAAAAARAERLYALKAVALAEVERARGALAHARSARAQAAAELARVRALREHLVGAGPVPAGTDEHEVLVRSPVDGVVVGRDAQPGTVVLVGAPLVTVSRTASLVLAMRLPERALAVARPGAAVRFTVPAFAGERFAARVTRVSPVLDSLTRTVEVQGEVLGGADRLRAGMYATAELLGAPGARALVVPAAAVQELEGDTVVVVARGRADGGAELEAVRVRVGRRNSERAELLAGLEPGTKVVTDGAAVAKAEILRRRGGG